MKCTNCGNKIAKKEAFCAACGIPVSQMPKKKTSPVLLALSIVLALSLIANVVLAMGKPASNKLEGKGFRTPEAAITAYAEAFAAGDVAGMLSTFAIESYVAHFDLEEQLAANAFYHFYQAEVGLPNDGVYKTQLNHYTRLAALTTQIKNGYYTLTEIDNSKAIIPFQRSTMEEEIEELMEQLEDPKFDQKLSSMRIGNVLTEEDFDCDAKAYKQALERYESYLDAEEFCDVAIKIKIDGESYYLFMLTAKFDGRWYNVTPDSPLGLLNSLPTNAGGFLD